MAGSTQAKSIAIPKTMKAWVLDGPEQLLVGPWHGQSHARPQDRTEDHRHDGRPLVGVIHADRCVAFVKVDGIRIATIDTLMALYLRAFVIGRATDNVRCLCDLLATLEHKHFNSEQPMFKRYVTECYGLTHDNDS